MLTRLLRRRVVLVYEHPPIPDRRCDWRAYRPGDEENGPFGWGATRREAVRDLREREAERV